VACDRPGGGARSSSAVGNRRRGEGAPPAPVGAAPNPGALGRPARTPSRPPGTARGKFDRGLACRPGSSCLTNTTAQARHGPTIHGPSPTRVATAARRRGRSATGRGGAGHSRRYLVGVLGSPRRSSRRAEGVAVTQNDQQRPGLVPGALSEQPPRIGGTSPAASTAAAQRALRCPCSTRTSTPVVVDLKLRPRRRARCIPSTYQGIVLPAGPGWRWENVTNEGPADLHRPARVVTTRTGRGRGLRGAGDRGCRGDVGRRCRSSRAPMAAQPHWAHPASPGRSQAPRPKSDVFNPGDDVRVGHGPLPPAVGARSRPLDARRSSPATTWPIFTKHTNADPRQPGPTPPYIDRHRGVPGVVVSRSIALAATATPAAPGVGVVAAVGGLSTDSPQWRVGCSPTGNQRQPCRDRGGRRPPSPCSTPSTTAEDLQRGGPRRRPGARSSPRAPWAPGAAVVGGRVRRSPAAGLKPDCPCGRR